MLVVLAAGGVGCCWCQGSTAEENVSLYKLGTQPRALSLPVSQENLSKYGDKPETMRLVTCRIHSNQVLPLLFSAWGTYLKKLITLNFCYRFISPFCTLVSLWEEEEFSEVFQSLGSTCRISQVFSFHPANPTATEVVWQTVTWPQDWAGMRLLRWALGHMPSKSYMQKLRK